MKIFFGLFLAALLLDSEVSSQLVCDEGLCLFDSSQLPPGLEFCITRDMLCDGIEQCKNGEDENNCAEAVCEKYHFKCDNICKSDYFRCNGKIDCQNGTDEMNCKEYDCGDRLKCKSETACVFPFEVCDGNFDCPDKSDEEGCFECESFKKKCGDFDSNCISLHQYCDLIEDCDDGSDERDCTDSCTADHVTPEDLQKPNCSSTNRSEPTTGICKFGLDGKYCNETCVSCRPPFCQSTIPNVNLYYKIFDYQENNSPPCVPSDVRRLDLKNIQLKNIHVGILDEISSNLEMLRMKNISYDCIDRDFISESTSSLIFLYLNDMGFTKETLPVFKNQHNLAVLNLDNNEITDLHDDTFSGSNDIITISMTHNRITNIQYELFRDQFSTLYELYLSFNLLSVNYNFDGLKRLRLLDLGHNCIEHIRPNAFENLRELERIYLQGNSLTKIVLLRGIALAPKEPLLVVIPNTLNCSSLDAQDQLNCSEEFHRYNANGLFIYDAIDECYINRCPEGSECTDFIGGFTCNDTLCNENDCSINKNGRCSRSTLGGGLIQVDDPCLNPCFCNQAATSVSCAEGTIDTSLLHENLCLPKKSTILELKNVVINATSFVNLLSSFGTFSTVRLTDMDTTSLDSIVDYQIDFLPKLLDIELMNASLTAIPTFITVFNLLTKIVISDNNISNIEDDTFLANSLLEELYLPRNGIMHISSDAFSGITRLRVLDLSQNKIVYFHESTFVRLGDLIILDVSKNSVTNYHPELLASQKKLTEVHGDVFTICCIVATWGSSSLTCTPKDDVSSCNRLIANETLRAFLWIQALVTALGNLTVIFLRAKEYKSVGRTIQQRTAKINIFLIGMLGLSDFLMCIYLFIIASADLIFAGEYYRHSHNWLTSTACSTAGVLAMLSGEVSVLLLSLITITRLLSIVQPFNYLQVDVRIFYFSTAGIWILGLVLANAPFMGFVSLAGYFRASVATCLPSLYTSTAVSSWIYTLVVVTINLIAFLLMTVAYAVLVYIAGRNSKRSKRLKMSNVATKKSGNAGKKLNARVAVLVITDMLCWIPVCVIAVYSLITGGLSDDVHAIIYPVTAIIILPINSTINPIVYTLLTSTSMSKRFKAAIDRLTSENESNIGNGIQKQSSNTPVKKRSEKTSSRIGEAFAALRQSNKLMVKENALPGIASGTCSTYLSNDNNEADEQTGNNVTNHSQ
ncbi:uncharacterized protein LOC120346000 [Styela clava]